MTDPAQFNVQDLPFFTPALPGIGGTLKASPEDFVVEEIPAYQPTGDGEHLFLLIEKRDVSAEQLTNHIARALEISRRDVGVAGLKDRRAVTRQFISVPAACEERLPAVETTAIHVLESHRHRNKLKTGHLHGNRFTIIVRNTEDDALNRVQAIAERIGATGFPNYFGSQRFGNDNSTLTTGIDLLTGKKTEKKLAFRKRRFLLRLSLSAVQSYLFNRVLAERIRDGLAESVMSGDVMRVTGTGGPFIAEDVPVEQQRLETGEIAITGPLFGPKMRKPQETPLDRERAVLAASGLSDDDFLRYAKLTPGTRRPILVRPANLTVEPTEDAIQLRFELPSGSYATVLLREFMKPETT